jgi:hypothetical protein
MNREYGDARYRSSRVEDHYEGYVGLELIRFQHGKDNRVARVLFWDSSGQFSAETLGTDIPLAILEELIAEAKESIKTG